MRLIDAEVLANWIDGSQRLDTEHDYEEVARYIEECPTVDAVPVVRCKDCKHRPIKPEEYSDGFDLEFPDKDCPCCCSDPFYSWYPSDNWFCPRGERKGGDDDV